MSTSSLAGSGVIYLIFFLVFKLLLSENLSFCSKTYLRSISLSSVDESSSQGLSFGLKFLDFQFVRTKPRAFSKLVATLTCSFLR